MRRLICDDTSRSNDASLAICCSFAHSSLPYWFDRQPGRLFIQRDCIDQESANPWDDFTSRKCHRYMRWIIRQLPQLHWRSDNLLGGLLPEELPRGQTSSGIERIWGHRDNFEKLGDPILQHDSIRLHRLLLLCDHWRNLVWWQGENGQLLAWRLRHPRSLLSNQLQWLWLLTRYVVPHHDSQQLVRDLQYVQRHRRQ